MAETVNAGSIDVTMTGNAGPFMAMLNQVQSGLETLQGQMSYFGIVGQRVTGMLTAVAGGIATAFAGKKALEAFANSRLPGASEYTKDLKETETTLKKLAAAVGEYLAPAVMLVNKIIRSIAEPLTGFIRQFTAFSKSSTDFLKALGMNFLAAFGQVMPTLNGIVQQIRGMFNGPAHNWAADVQKFRDWWNTTWRAILTFTAPIMVAVAQAIDGVIGKAIALGPAIQRRFIVAAQAVRFAFENWRQVAQTAWVAIQAGAAIAVDYIKSAWQQGMAWIGSQIKSAMTTAGDYVMQAWNRVWDYIKQVAAKVGTAVMGVVTPIIAFANSAASFISGVFSAVTTSLKTVYTILSTIYSVVTFIPGQVLGIAGAFGGLVTVVWEVLKGINWIYEKLVKIGAITDDMNDGGWTPITSDSLWGEQPGNGIEGMGPAGEGAQGAPQSAMGKWLNNLPSFPELPALPSLGIGGGGESASLIDSLISALKGLGESFGGFLGPGGVDDFIKNVIKGLPDVKADVQPELPPEAKYGNSQGTFNAAIKAGSLGFSSAAERTAKATELTAKNTGRLLRPAAGFGM